MTEHKTKQKTFGNVTFRHHSTFNDLNRKTYTFINILIH